MNGKATILKKVMIAAWLLTGCGFLLGIISDRLSSLTRIAFIFVVVPMLLTIMYRQARDTQKKENPDMNTAPSTAPAEPTSIAADDNLDRLMTGQLIACFKKAQDEKYRNEYIRRLVHIGFQKHEAFNLFTNESMNMKHDAIALLQDPSYLTKNYFDLKHKLLPFENPYYAEHRVFTVSEITKIWDEAEWHYHNSHEASMPEEVWHEIYTLTRYGGGELFIQTLSRIAESSHIDMRKIQKYAMSEQNMLFKYKWNPAGNEPHPYH